MQITITHNESEIIIPLREPTFEELAAAFMALTRPKGGTDIAGAGRVLLKACADYSKTPDILWKNPKREFSAAL